LNMKKHILTAVILTSLSIHAVALPQNNPQPLLGEMQDSNVKSLMGFGTNLQTEGGADRVHERQTDRLRLAEGGAERTWDRQQDRLRVAEGGADRVHERQMDRLRLAEGGAERLSERQQQLKRTS
jgi:hypothetical protein